MYIFFLYFHSQHFHIIIYYTIYFMIFSAFFIFSIYVSSSTRLPFMDDSFIIFIIRVIKFYLFLCIFNANAFQMTSIDFMVIFPIKVIFVNQ